MRRIDFPDKTMLSKIYKVKIFRYLNDNEKEALLKIADCFEYNKDEKVITQDEISSCFYAIISGNLIVTVNSESGKEIELSKIYEGDFFGETGIFTDGQKRTANIVCVDNAQVLRFGRNDFYTFIRTYPHAGVNLLMLFVHGLIKRIHNTNKELAVERDDSQDQIPFFDKSNL